MTETDLLQPRSAEERTEFDEQLRKHTEIYHQYGLSKNPFPLGGNYPDAYLEYTYLNDRTTERIHDFLFSTFVREEFNGLLVLGEYGAGKSHVLHYVRDTVLKDPFFGKQALCFLIQNPSVSPEDILLSMLREVKLGVVQDLLFRPVASELKKIYHGKILEFLSDYTNFAKQKKLYDGDYNPWGDLDLFACGYREFIAKITDLRLVVDYKKLHAFAKEAINRSVQIDVSTIAGDLVELIASDDVQNTRSWESFLSSRLLRSRKSALGAEYYLQAFLELFKNSGVRHVYLLVDELEDLRTQRLSPKASVEYLATLRKMIQYNYKMFSFVLACTRDAWRELTILYPAIDDRFPLKVELLPDQAEIKRVVLNYLAKERLDSERSENEWMPFTPEAIEEVIKTRGLVLRHILTELRNLLDTALNKKISPPLDAQFVKSVLS